MAWLSTTDGRLTNVTWTKMSSDVSYQHNNAYYLDDFTLWTGRDPNGGDTFYVWYRVRINQAPGGKLNPPHLYFNFGDIDYYPLGQPTMVQDLEIVYMGSRGAGASNVGTIFGSIGANYTYSSTQGDCWAYANFSAAHYAIAYSGNGASGGSTTGQTKWYGTNLVLRGNGFGRTGYHFTNWNTRANGTGTSYAAGATYTANAAATMYAQWAIDTYTIAYNANGGTNAPSSQTKTYNVALTLTTAQPTRTGYTFKGWATSSTGSVVYSSGGQYLANAGATLYAVWQIITYAVTYNGNGATGGSTDAQTKTYGTNLVLRSNGFTRTSYSFLNWNTKADGSGTTYAAGATYTTNAALALYAIWKKNNIPLYVNVGGTIHQVEKAYANVNGTIKECTVYTNVNGTIKELT